MLITKAHHAEVVAALREVIAAKDAELARVRTDLAEAQMRERLALAEPKPAQPVALPAKREPSAVDTAIALRSNGDRRLRSYLVDYARKARAEGQSEDDIADAILHGEKSTDDDGVDD